MRTLWEYCLASAEGETDKVTSGMVEETWYALLAGGKVTGLPGPKEPVVMESCESMEMIDPETLVRLEGLTSDRNDEAVDGLMLLAESIVKLGATSDCMIPPAADGPVVASVDGIYREETGSKDGQETKRASSHTEDNIETSATVLEDHVDTAKELEDAIRKAAAKGYRIQPLINGQWINTEDVKDWRVVYQPFITKSDQESVIDKREKAVAGLTALKTQEVSLISCQDDCDSLLTPVSPVALPVKDQTSTTDIPS